MIVRSGGSQKLSVIRNRQWSITALAEITGPASASIVEHYTYTRFGASTTHDAAGTVISATAYNNNFGYPNREHDLESGLMHFRSRYFDVGTGEIASRDPLAFVDGMSLYRGYFGVVGMDPLGFLVVIEDDAPPVTQRDIFYEYGIFYAFWTRSWSISDALSATNQQGDAFKNDGNRFGYNLHMAWLRPNLNDSSGVYNPTLGDFLQVRSECRERFVGESSECVDGLAGRDAVNGVFPCPVSRRISIGGTIGSTGTMRQGNFDWPNMDEGETPSNMFMAIGGFGLVS